LFGPERICGVVAAGNAAEMARGLATTLAQTRLVELRLDWLESEKETVRFLEWLRGHRREATHVILIATLRRRATGGRFRGSVAAQLALLGLAVRSGCDWADVEVETAEWLLPGALRRILGEARCIVSFHGFRAGGMQPEAALKRIARTGAADVSKLALHADSPREVARLLAVTRGRKKVIAVPMGDASQWGRVLALREGSALAYAATANETAPGQLTLQQMKKLYRADQLDRRTRVYGVIGDPVAHSLSPQLHNAGFAARRMNSVYLPFLVRDLRDFLQCARPLGVRGFSVTLPHKQAILSHLDECDLLAAKIGAVNTVVVRRGGKLAGYNTDYAGVLRALARRIPLRGSRVLIYGAGGAARSVAFALTEAGGNVWVCARRPKQAEELARAAQGYVVQRSALRQEFFDAIVNATPVGMHPRVNESPLEAAELNCRLVFDLVYMPRKTRLLELAHARGVETVSGVEMFIAQAVAQWEIWTGERAPEKIMRRAVLEALGREPQAGPTR
jgi:3-dehydroquinate dehydratase / shikimate dehydrogenase